ncbi:MAG TPA: E3 ubiquitin ligase, partial [Spirochaetia bacterium]|nr:E3 ubiquitin ligase [Spirochaetia bacterium]
FGGLSFALSGLTMGAGTRTLGYRYEEEAIPVGKNLYVLGEAVDAGGELAIQKPADKKAKFIISVKSEEELVRKAQSSMTALWVIGAICGAAGVTVTVLSLLGMITF